MKKLMSVMIGLGLLIGTGTLFAQEQKTDETKKTEKKKGKKKGGKKKTEEPKKEG